MKYIFELSNDMPNLGREEIQGLINSKIFKIRENIVILEINNKKIANKIENRIAYTKNIYEVLFESNPKKFLNNFENYDWNKVYKSNFCIRINNLKTNNEKFFKKNIINEKNLASIVWKNANNPKVKLVKSKTPIHIIITNKKIYCCLLKENIINDFNERRSHLRPRPSPISLHPKLARSMVNLTGARGNDLILDPFCGSGGILIEAGLMGMKPIGYDINKKMIWKSMVNLEHYKIRNHVLNVKDFFQINRKYKFIVTDLPYGLNTNIMDKVRVTRHNKGNLKKYLNEFYKNVILKLNNILLKRAVIIFPDHVNYKKLLKKTRLKIRNEFESYVHGNLTRKIVVLEK